MAFATITERIRVVSLKGSNFELFNQAEFFEAREVLEGVWRAPAAEKKFLWA